MTSRSERIRRKVRSLPEFRRAPTIASYVAKGDEVQTAGIIEDAMADGKRVLVPRSDPRSTELVFAEIRSLSELRPGHFGILEPSRSAPEVLLSLAQVALVPIVAWDEKGERIGHGKGYFDRALGANRTVLTIGLALESQRVNGIPTSTADVPLDVIVTEERVLHFRRHAH